MNETRLRTATIERVTGETRINLNLNLDGSGTARVQTGIGFLDHMLTALAKHSRMDISLSCDGDLEVDTHHTTEDCALVLGQGIREALGNFSGIERFGSAYAPLDEALVRVVVDLCGRPFSVVEIPFRREQIGALPTEDITHFFQSLAIAMGAALHVDLIRGANDHHKSEAAFKAVALALRSAMRTTGTSDIPSTKGVLG